MIETTWSDQMFLDHGVSESQLSRIKSSILGTKVGSEKPILGGAIAGHMGFAPSRSNVEFRDGGVLGAFSAGDIMIKVVAALAQKKGIYFKTAWGWPPVDIGIW